MADWTSVVAAGVGGSVALFAALLTSRADSRIRRAERSEERSESARKDSEELRRTNYTEVYAASRLYMGALGDYLNVVQVALKASPDQRPTASNHRDAVESARAAFIESRGKAIMIVSNDVLMKLAHMNSAFENLYKLSVRLDDEYIDTQRAQAYLNDRVDSTLGALMAAMRADLGIAPVGPEEWMPHPDDDPTSG